MLEDGDVPFKDQPEFLNTLGKMCHQLKTIPDSMHIENCPFDLMDEEWDRGCATVYQSEYRGRPVTIKILRLYLTSDLEECFNVSTKLSQMQWEIHSHCGVSRNFAEKLLPGGTYNTWTSYRLLVLIWNSADLRWYLSGWITVTSMSS